MQQEKKHSTQKMVRLAIFAAVMVVLASTPLGYIPINMILPFLPLALQITILVLPVVVGGLVLGRPAGLVLGTIFGLTSLVRAFADPLGMLLLSQNAVMAVLLFLVPRMAVGVFADGMGALTQRAPSLRRFWFYALAGLGASLCNTVLFLGGMVLFFDLSSVGGAMVILGIGTALNGVVEAVANAVLAGVLTKGLLRRVK